MKKLEEKEVEYVQMVLSYPRGCQAYGVEYGDHISIAKHVNFMGSYNCQNSQPM